MFVISAHVHERSKSATWLMIKDKYKSNCVKILRMSDTDDVMDHYPDMDDVFSGENVSNKGSPSRTYTQVNSIVDDERSKSEVDEDEDESDGNRRIVHMVNSIFFFFLSCAILDTNLICRGRK